MANKCKVCDHKKVGEINRLIRNGDSINSIHLRYGLSRGVLKKHKDNCMPTLLKGDDKVKNALKSDSLMEQVEQNIQLVRKMVIACDEYLKDPNDPEAYFLGPRSHEVEVKYQELDEEGKPLPGMKKADLQELIERHMAPDKFTGISISIKTADPRDLLLKSIGKLESTVKMIHDSTQKLIKWEHEKRALDKIANDNNAVISVEKQVETIVQRVVVASGSSNSEELSKLAGLPEV